MENENISSDLATFTIKHLTKFKDKVGEQNQIDFKEYNKILYKRDGPYLFVMNNLSKIKATSITNHILQHGKLES